VHSEPVSEGPWERWESLRSSEDPDPIEVLETVAYFQRYFKAVEREAIRAARGRSHTWEEIGSALGRTRQAVWQRADSEALKRISEDGWSRSAEVRFKIGLDLP